MEDFNKVKNSYKREKDNKFEKRDLREKKYDFIFEENRLVNLQRDELLSVFRKQMDVIDIMEKEKIHLESANLLKFTEEEFVKALNIDG